MLITGIVKGKGNKYRVYGDEEYLFSLYGKELKRYHIAEQENVEEDLITAILNEVIYKRARERALFLLESRPMTVKMVRDKLKQNEYPDEIISMVVEFLLKYHYLDDMNYIDLYMQTYSLKKSKKQIMLELGKKGVSKELIDGYLETHAFSDEQGFKVQFEKYTRDKDLSDYKIRQKAFRYFYGKGYGSSMIEGEIRHKIESV